MDATVARGRWSCSKTAKQYTDEALHSLPRSSLRLCSDLGSACGGWRECGCARKAGSGKTVSPSCWTRAVRPLEATPCSLENMQGLQQRVAPWFHTCWTGWGTGLTSSNLEAPQKTRVLACSLERKGDIAMSAVDENHVRGATNICRRAPAFGSPPPTPFTTAFVGVHALGGGGQ